MIYECPRCHQTALMSVTCPACARGKTYVTMRPITETRMPELAAVSVADLPRLAIPGFPGIESSLAGGFVVGSVTLLHAGPGMGKTTLALQLGNRIQRMARTLYVTTEQMLSHIKLMADRLGVGQSFMRVMATTNLDEITEVFAAAPIKMLIIDSLQRLMLYREHRGTMMVAVCNEVVSLAQSQQCAVLLVCHETKDDEFAGPRTLEHIVDGMVKLEQVNTLRTRWHVYNKYRFGAVPAVAWLGRDPDTGRFYEWRDDKADHGRSLDALGSPRNAAEDAPPHAE